MTSVVHPKLAQQACALWIRQAKEDERLLEQTTVWMLAIRIRTNRDIALLRALESLIAWAHTHKEE